MAVPVVQSVPAAVIAGGNKSSRVAVRGRFLYPGPEFLQSGIEELNRSQDPVVTAAVGPVVGLIEGDVQEAWLDAFQIFHGQA